METVISRNTENAVFDAVSKICGEGAACMDALLARGDDHLEGVWDNGAFCGSCVLALPSAYDGMSALILRDAAYSVGLCLPASMVVSRRQISYFSPYTYVSMCPHHDIFALTIICYAVSYGKGCSMAEHRLRDNTFKKCDLHVHSSSCYSRSYLKADFLKALINSDLDAVAITDHNSIDVPLLLELDEELRKVDKTLFAGVELNIALNQETINNYCLVTKGKYFHALVICDLKDAQSLSDSVDDLFAAADTSLLTAQHELLNGSITHKDYSEKTKGKSIYLEDLRNKISHIRHYFIPHENKGSRNLTDYLPIKDEYGDFCTANDSYKDRLFYYSHAMAVEGGEKSRKGISLNIEKALNTTVSALLFGDAQKLQEIGEKFTWIDFDLDLDSLLLAISDPGSRLRTSDQYAELPQTNSRDFLESVSFDVKDKSTPTGKRNVVLHFAPGYNGIVGSRGSGKSLLAHILDGQNLADYESFIDRESIRYVKKGGIQTQTPPASIYLAQGALEKIFENESYSDIEFLRKYIEPDKKESERLSKEAAARTTRLLIMQKELIIAFLKKYPSGTISIGYLNTPEPSGVILPSAPAVSKGDKAQLKEAKILLEQFEKSLEDSRDIISRIDLVPVFPEDAKLLKTLASEVAELRDVLSALIARAALLTNSFEGCNRDWFATRQHLVEEFDSLLMQLNAKNNSTQKNDYTAQQKKAAGFYDDLLELRLALAFLDEEIAHSRSEELSPIPSREVQSAGQEISIRLGFQDKNGMSYCDHADALIKGHAHNHLDGLVRACLACAESSSVAEIFNKSKIKISSRPSNAKEYISKYFEMLERDLGDDKFLDVDITLGGESVKNMSPGMRAHALLQLFLNDEISKKSQIYVILDQPEDNLDVKTIGDFLVRRLKELKSDIQLFVISHSAPVVVNGDARKIIVCNNADGTIRYTEGTLSNDIVKKEAATVLDGGELYLKMRFNKYNFQVGDIR